MHSYTSDRLCILFLQLSRFYDLPFRLVNLQTLQLAPPYFWIAGADAGDYDAADNGGGGRARGVQGGAHSAGPHALRSGLLLLPLQPESRQRVGGPHPHHLGPGGGGGASPLARPYQLGMSRSPLSVVSRPMPFKCTRGNLPGSLSGSAILTPMTGGLNVAW